MDNSYAQLVAQDLRYIWHPCSQMKDYEKLPPMIIERAHGVYLYAEDGKKYLDIISSWWCNLLGHNHPRINAAITQQLAKFAHVIFANFSHSPAITLCAELSKVLPSSLCKFHFSDDGSTAVECALKMSFQYQQQIGQARRTRFMCLSESYHGETIGALSVSGLDLYAKIYQPLLNDVLRIPAPDCYRCPFQQSRENCDCECFTVAEKLFAENGATVAALIVEPLLQGSAGMRMYPPRYLQKLRTLCDEYAILLIADEVATGMGRTGKMFACEHAAIIPDIICLGKGLTGGYLPLALTIATEKIYQAFYADYHTGRAFMHSHTYSGNALGCVAAVATLQILREENILSVAAKRALYLREKLLTTFADLPYVGEIRTLGLINAIELVADRATKQSLPREQRSGYQIYQNALANGLLLRPLGDVLYFNPPLTITESEIDEAIAITEKSLRQYFADK